MEVCNTQCADIGLISVLAYIQGCRYLYCKGSESEVSGYRNSLGFGGLVEGSLSLE